MLLFTFLVPVTATEFLCGGKRVAGPNLAVLIFEVYVEGGLTLGTIYTVHRSTDSSFHYAKQEPESDVLAAVFTAIQTKYLSC